MRAVAPDHPGLLQSAYPAMAGGNAEPDPVSQFGNGKTPIELEFSKDFAVDLIHLE